MGRRWHAAAVTVAAAAALGAPGAAVADDHPVIFPVSFAPGAYAPSSLEIAAGDTVTFSGGFGSHPLVWTDGDFATQSTGTSHQYAFPRPGLYRFHCAIHTTVMVGAVHIAGNRFATPDFTVAPAAPQTGQAVTFDASSVADPDGTIVRYEWDLDGDGTFETATTAPRAGTTYANAQTVAVSLRYVDDGHETSPATTRAVTVAAAPAIGTTDAGGATPQPAGNGTGSPAPAGSTTGAGATTAPAGDQGVGATVRVASRALAFRRGSAALRLQVARAADVQATLRRGGVVLARGRSRLAAGDRRLRLRLTSAGARRLHRRAVTAVLTVQAGTGAPRRVTLRVSAAAS